MFPYLDLAGFTARTAMPGPDVALLEQLQPGFFEQAIATRSSWINTRLRKRYGKSIPFGQGPSDLLAAGTTPPEAKLQGRPVLGSLRLMLDILAAGALGTSTFWWSADGGLTWTMAPLLAASGPTPPAVGVSGASELSTPSQLLVNITTGGTLGTARFQWSADGGNTWDIGSAMSSSGTTPPAVSISGTSNVALPDDIQIEITTGGPLGTAIFQWSLDGGSTWTTGLQTSATPVPLGQTGLSATFSLGTYATNNAYVGQGNATAATYVLGSTGLTLDFAAGTYSSSDSYVGQGILTAASVPLGETGLSVLFNPGTYGSDNVYAAATPVPETVLGWLTRFVTLDGYERRGVNAQDPAIERVIAAATQAAAEVQEAADGNLGLFDLPTNEDAGSAITTSGPLGHSDTSPYAWQDRQARGGYAQDGREFGPMTWNRIVGR